MFLGTFTGMATALTAGIFISLMLAVSKLFIKVFGKKDEEDWYEEEAEEVRWD